MQFCLCILLKCFLFFVSFSEPIPNTFTQQSDIELTADNKIDNLCKFSPDQNSIVTGDRFSSKMRYRTTLAQSVSQQTLSFGDGILRDVAYSPKGDFLYMVSIAQTSVSLYRYPLVNGNIEPNNYVYLTIENVGNTGYCCDTTATDTKVIMKTQDGFYVVDVSNSLKLTLEYVYVADKNYHLLNVGCHPLKPQILLLGLSSVGSENYTGSFGLYNLTSKSYFQLDNTKSTNGVGFLRNGEVLMQSVC